MLQFFRRLNGPIAAALIAAGFLHVGAVSLPAHGDDHLVIEALTEELERVPDANLFIRRGELLRHHQEWAKADADFLAAATLDPKLALIDFVRARTWLEAGEPTKAQPLIERYVANVPNEPEGWFLRGDMQAARGQHERGAEDYAQGIARATSPRPEHFLRRARFLAAIPNPDISRVIAALDEGIAQIGPVISLVDYALTLEIEQKDYPRALQRIAAAMERAPRRENWLVRQGNILVLCGRTAEAIDSYQAALAAIAELPERYRDTVPMEKLARDAHAALARLGSKS